MLKFLLHACKPQPKPSGTAQVGYSSSQGEHALTQPLLSGGYLPHSKQKSFYEAPTS